MPANKLIFKDAEKARDSITAAQKKQISKLYDEWANDIGKLAEKYAKSKNPSAYVTSNQLRQLKKQLKAYSEIVVKEAEGVIKSNIYSVSEAVVASNLSWFGNALKSIGYNSKGLEMAFSDVPDNIVQKLVTGQIYESGWSLSKRIWGANEEALKDIYGVIAKGLAENRPIYEIAKNLEAYVRPGAKMPWNLAAKDGIKIYKKQVDYNAQRLARTLVQHGYQQSFVETTKNNPFVLSYIWLSNGSRVCPVCKARDGEEFDKNNLPLDHPNGMCTMVPNVDDKMIDKLADWVNSPEGTYPDIDDFANELGYGLTTKSPSLKDYISKYGTSTKSYGAWYKSLSSAQKAEAKLLKDKTGLSWEKWYKENVYVGDGSNFYGKKRASQSTVISSGKIPNYTSWIDKIKKQTEEYMLKKEEKWMKLIGQEGIDGIIRYSGSSYEEMNAYLRYLQAGLSEADAILRSGISQNQLANVKNAIDGLKNVILDEDFVLRRGTDLGDLAGAFMQGNFASNKQLLMSKSVDELNDMFAGAVGKYGSFTSTSSIWDKGFTGDVEVVLYAPKGTNASSIMKISNFGTGEGETLLNANTTVRCVKIEESDWHKGSSIRVFLEILTK